MSIKLHAGRNFKDVSMWHNSGNPNTGCINVTLNTIDSIMNSSKTKQAWGRVGTRIRWLDYTSAVKIYFAAAVADGQPGSWIFWMRGRVRKHDCNGWCLLYFYLDVFYWCCWWGLGSTSEKEMPSIHNGMDCEVSLLESQGQSLLAGDFGHFMENLGLIISSMEEN